MLPLFQALLILKESSLRSMFLLLPLLLLFCIVLNLKKSVKAMFPKLPMLPLFQALLILKESSLRSMFLLLPLLLLFCTDLNMKISVKATSVTELNLKQITDAMFPL